MKVRGLPTAKRKNLEWLQYEYRITAEEAYAIKRGQEVDLFGECADMLVRDGLAELLEDKEQKKPKKVDKKVDTNTNRPTKIGQEE